MFLSVNEAAQRLGVSIWTVKRWIKKGKLQGIRIGGWWKVDEAEVKRFIRESQGKSK